MLAIGLLTSINPGGSLGERAKRPGSPASKSTGASSQRFKSAPPTDGVAEAYGPRRKVLDKILLDAAVEAGVEVREGFPVEEIPMEGERVFGFRGRVKRMKMNHRIVESNVYEKKELIFVAKVKDGFVSRIRDELFPGLKVLQTAQCPFGNLPEKRASRWGESLTAEKMEQCRWVKPKLVCQVAFVEWTDAGHLRHCTFVTMRDDKKPAEVVRES